MINDDKINLPVCAFGAGLAHAAALALILPIVITLPAPADPVPQLVAIHVEIQPAAAEPVAQGDAEDSVPPVDTLDPAEITGALPAPAEAEDPNDAAALDASEPDASEPDVTEPDASEEALGPESESDGSEPLGAVANVDAEQIPAAVPLPPRRPEASEAVENSGPPAKATPNQVPRKFVTVSRPRPRTASNPVNKKLLLGGRTATPMPEYPSPAQPLGGPD